jgi:short-subunit dehydrogenase
VLVLNAAKTSYGPITSVAAGAVNSLLNVNIVSSVNLVNLLAPKMIERKKLTGANSRIAVIGSVISNIPSANLGLYTASKAFLSTFTQVRFIIIFVCSFYSHFYH